MGVMECYRSDCPSIMCRRYSSEYGYLCDYCFEELVNQGVTQDIEAFMKQRPQWPDKDAAERYFEYIFPREDW